MGSPASSWMTSGATKCRETSTSPDARTFDIPAVVVLTYLMSLNPSAFSSSPTMYWGATQTPRRVIEPQSRRLGRRLRPDPRWSNSSEPGRPRQRQPADELASAPALALVTHGDLLRCDEYGPRSHLRDRPSGNSLGFRGASDVPVSLHPGQPRPSFPGQPKRLRGAKCCSPRPLDPRSR